VWQTAPAADGFVQSDPREGQPATEATLVYVAFDDEYLYIGARCLDTDPSGIVVNDIRKDFAGAEQDTFEVLLDTFVVVVGTNRRNLARIAVDAGEHPVGGQLMGSNPDDFPPAARRLVAEGYDVIDINFGCPVKKVLGRCRGGYLLSQPATALEIVAKVRDAVPPHVPVTLKMRRGLDDTPASLDNFWTIFDGAFARGAAAITVHGRTVKQKYVGPSSWEFLAAVKRHAGQRIVIGSGDLFSAAACVAMLDATGVDAVSVARGVSDWSSPTIS
jgi:tRNA-dihydrouridine synthase